MGPADAGRHRMPVNRVHLLLVAFVVFVLLIGYRVISVQIVRSEELGERAVAERLETETVPAQRGDILDSGGMRLATNVPRARVWAILPQLEDPAGTASTLAPLVGMSEPEIMERLQDPDVQWTLLARQIPYEAATAIEALELDGIVVESEPGRVYPNDTFASHILGFTNYEHEGAYGVEGAYDEKVGGKPGALVGERDGAGNIIALSPSTWDPPEDGADLVLTIDSAVQRIVERVLRETIEEQDAVGGTIIVQDPQTGAILGMASWPVFNPNSFEDVDDISVFANPAISRVYEPGSTFKSIVMAIAIDAGIVQPDTTFDDSPGYLEVPGYPPITNNNGAVYGVQTMTEILVRSSNLGAVHVAKLIGAERLYKRMTQFGIGRDTGIDLQGEERGILTKPWESDWNQTLFYTNAFGQGLATTPVQMVNAYSAIINGGHLMRPYVVAEEHWPDGTVKQTEPTVVREVISEESSATMREMLNQVVEQRFEAYPQIPGYNIGAKTGTAQVPSPDGGYLEDETIASIVGFGPVEDPQFTVLVKIDQPQESPWGETVAGPAMKEVLSELFVLYGIPPTEAQ